MILKIKREKFKEITAIKINGQIINRVKCPKLLGLNVDDELSWTEIMLIKLQQKYRK